MFAKTLKLNKRVLITVATVVVLAIALFAITPGISMAGPATSPSSCGACAG